MTDSSRSRMRMRLVAERDGWSCHYCGIKLVPTGQEAAICRWVPEYVDAGWWLDPDQGICHCGEHAPGEPCGHAGYWAPPDDYAWPTTDHKIPRAKGGGDSITNLVMACMKCNCLKGPRSYEFFMASMG